MKLARLAIGCLALGVAMPAVAFDYSLSGFATIGYAISDRPYNYQRFIDDGGTFRRDSVAGLQVDATFTNEIGATVQLKGAPSTSDDRRYEASASWAFVSFRPSNDWLFRAGKQRIPLYLYSETYDVGATYDFVRLPTEMYSLAPSNDFIGLSFSRSLRLGNGEVSIDGLYGRSNNDFRAFLRDDIPGVQQRGPFLDRLKFKGGGLVLTYRTDDLTLRLAALRVTLRLRDRTGIFDDYPFVSLAPGVGYYQVSNALPGPGLQTSSALTNSTITAGLETKLPADFRFIGEFARSVERPSRLAPQGNRGYVALLRSMGKWTPYVTYAFLRSPESGRQFYTSVNDNAVPPFIPGAPLINASQQAGADNILVYDQSSWALGTSYSFSPKSKLKAEVLRTRIRDASQLVDPPPGTTIRHQSVDVYSLSYSVVF